MCPLTVRVIQVVQDGDIIHFQFSKFPATGVLQTHGCGTLV
jgi:hypothetical protein